MVWKDSTVVVFNVPKPFIWHWWIDHTIWTLFIETFNIVRKMFIIICKMWLSKNFCKCCNKFVLVYLIFLKIFLNKGYLQVLCYWCSIFQGLFNVKYCTKNVSNVSSFCKFEHETCSIKLRRFLKFIISKGN